MTGLLVLTGYWLALYLACRIALAVEARLPDPVAEAAERMAGVAEGRWS